MEWHCICTSFILNLHLVLSVGRHYGKFSDRCAPQNSKYHPNIYLKTKCAIISDGKLTDWFKVGVGVMQGYILSSFF